MGDFASESLGVDGFRVAPNPFQSTVDLSFRVESPGVVSLKVYSVGGRLVRTLMQGEATDPVLTRSWDARDEQGNRVVNGTYFARLERAGRTDVRRIVLLR